VRVRGQLLRRQAREQVSGKATVTRTHARTGQVVDKEAGGGTPGGGPW